MPKIDISKEQCKGCELCISACPKHVIKMSEDLNTQGYLYAKVEHEEDCVYCKLCAVACPDVGIKIENDKEGAKS